MGTTKSDVAPEPCGVLAIMTSPDGVVIATAADFERQAVGGFKLWEGQRHRARERVMWATVRAYCSPSITEAMDTYLVGQIVERLRNKGHRLTCRAVGYPDDIAAEVAR